MDENNQNPYTEQNYKPQKPRKPKKPGETFGMVSVTFGMITWGIFVLMSIITCSIFWVFSLGFVDVMCIILAILAIIFGAIQNMYYEKSKMADIGIAMGILFPIFLLLDMALGLLYGIGYIIYLVITGSW